jgi:hypothetical protein
MAEGEIRSMTTESESELWVADREGVVSQPDSTYVNAT